MQLLLILAACSPPGIVPPPQPPDRSSQDTADSGAPDGDADTDADADTDVDTDTDTDADPLDYDCDDLPTSDELEGQMFDWARGYHDVTFDDDGYLVGCDTGSGLVKSSYDGTAELWIPSITYAETMDRFPDGSFVISASGRLQRVYPDGGVETLASNVGGAKGVTVGPDGKVYYANGGVHRLDPETGEAEMLLPQLGPTYAWHTVFSLDSTRLFIATYGQGKVYYLDLDEDLNPTGEPQEYASNVGGSWHDGIGIDACGNLYVAEYTSLGLYRVRTDGSVEPIGPQGNGQLYGHGLEFGSGLGGWRQDALYLPVPYNGNKVRELVVGVPSGETVQTWNGEPIGR